MSRISEESLHFVESLPASYRQGVRPEAMVVHARLADERSGPVCVGAFEQRGDLTGVCIVADDQPGLLATISEAMVHCQMDVVNAEVFTRRIGARTEAVDLFWLRKLDGGRPVVVTPEHVVELQRTLEELLDNTFEPREVNLPVADGVTASESRVRFIEDEEGALSTLEIETEDRSGLLYSLSRALFAQRVHVLRCEVRTESSRRVVDRFKIAESDGSAVGPGRRLEIQVAVLSAIEPAKRLSSAAPGCPDP